VSGSSDYLPLLCAGVAAAAILVYVLMEGWELGVGILFPLVARQADRDLLFESIHPLWGVNETWLAVGGMLMLLAYPTACSLLLTQLYLPILAMLFALALRAVSYEFRYRTDALRRIGGLAFAGGSILAALAQGYIVGRLIEGVGGNVVISGLLGWLRDLFPIACSFALLGGYGLLGACWLILKAKGGALQVMGREASHSTLVLATTLSVAVCLLTPMVSPHVARLWFTPSMQIALVLIAATVGVAIWRLWTSLWRSADQRPLQWSLIIFVLTFASLAISLYPYIVPYQFTLYEMANHGASLRFAGIGTYVVLLVIMIYVLLGYWTFRGKARRVKIPAAQHLALASRKTCGNNVDLHLS
jgi:cytochrome bd ubiquinol oxidase subunit II